MIKVKDCYLQTIAEANYETKKKDCFYHVQLEGVISFLILMAENITNLKQMVLQHNYIVTISTIFNSKITLDHHTTLMHIPSESANGTSNK